MFNKRVKQKIGFLVLMSQLSSAMLPLVTFAAPQSVQGSDIQNSLETVGTKANRLKTVGNSGVDESTGAFTYSYPFALPKGLMGLEPSIVLSYNSQSTENSNIGYGFNMAIPYIERTAKYGVDKIYSKNDFVSSLGGELIQKTNTSNQYIQKIDDGSYQLYILNNNIWTLTDRSGNVYTFGTTLDSRLCDNTCSKIQKYYLTEVRDIFGNKIKYFYEKKNNTVYPKEIIYTIKKDGTYSNKIVFEREDRADKEVSYRSGFRTELTDRIKTIRAYTDNVEVAKLELSYTTGQNGTRSLLSSIKESRLGSDNLWSTIPETKFEYEKGTNLTFSTGNYLSPGYTMIDVSGDGKPEILSLDANNNGNSYTPGDFDGNYLTDLYFNHQIYECWNGTKTSGIIRMNYDGQLKDFDLKLSDYKNLPVTHYTNYPCSGESGQGFVSPSIQDVNGDGFQDILSPFASSSTPSEYMEDINGDGLVDKTGTYSSSTKPELNGEYFFLNNGNGWNSFPELNYKIPFTYKIRSTYNKEWDGGFRIVDLNADGLADLVKSWKSTQQSGGQVVFVLNGPAGRGYYQPEIANPGSENEVYLNTGLGFIKSTNVNLNNNYVVNYSGTFSNNFGYNSDGTVSFTGANWAGAVNTMQFYDTNGDGSVDFGGGVSSFKKQDILKTVVSPLGAKSEITYKGSVQQNNPKLPINILTVSEIKNTEVNKNLVDTTKYQYENGKMYFDKNNVYDRRFAGFQKVTTETGTPTNSKKVVKYFHQGDGDDATTFERGDSFHNIGRVYKEEIFGTSGTVATKYTDTYRTYGVYNWDGQIYKYPKLEVVTEYDKNGNTFSKATQYEYDLAARLPKQTENFGEVKWDIATGNFTDVGEDYVQTKNIYNTKRPQKLLAEESFDINGKFLDKKLYFYDELPFGYVEKGLLNEERNYSSANNYVKTTYTYHPTGLVATKTENNGAVTTFTYDANYNPSTVANALNQTTSTTYNKVLGVQISSTNPNGKIINTVYDGFGNVKSVSATSPKDDTVKLTATKNISYTGSGMTETESVYNEGSVYKTSTKIYDSFGRLVKSQNTNTENSNQTIDVTYNNLGQMVKVSYPYDTNGILAGYFSANDTNYSYDELGRNVSVSQGDLTNFTDYIVNGKISRDNTPDQHKKEYKYNSLGKLASVKEYTNTTNFNETKYEWNLLGNLTKLTDAMGNVRNFQYDSEGRLLKQEDLHAPTDNTFGTYSYTYDNNGLLISKKDPSNNVATFEYDLLNRPKKESFGVVTNYVYDTCQNGVGALCEVNNSQYSQTLKYTKAGNISTETKNIANENDSKTFIQMYEYNDLGQNTKIVLPDSSYITYSYDTNGKQKTASLTRMINNNASTTQIVTDATYNIDGTIKNYTAGNGAKTCYEYSSVNGGNVLPRLSKINVTNNSDCSNPTNTNLLFSQELKYNLFGSIVENKEIFGANNFNSGTQSEVLNTYQYDVLQRLTKSERLENNLNVVNNLSYNSIGNILSSDSTNYSYTGADYQNPHAPSVIGGTAMSYDLNGNILSDGKNIYEWNYKNTLKKVVNDKSISEYTYDISGERIKEVVKAKTNVGTSTFAGETLAYSGEEFFNDYANIVSTTSDKNFMSKTAYDEVKNLLSVATVTTSHITDMVNRVYTTKFVTDTCKNVSSNDKEKCLRETTLKVVYATNKKEKNISLSFGTLQEIWAVFRGDVKVDGDVYTPKTFSKVMNEKSVDTDVFMDIVYVGQPTQYNEYTNNYSICYVYKLGTNGNYNCNFIAKNWQYPNYDSFELENAKFQFLSNQNTPTNFFNVGSVENINLATTSKFASTTNFVSIATTSASTMYQGYYVYSTDVTNLAKEQIKNNSKVAFKVLGKTNDNGTYYNQILSAYLPFSDSKFKPSITLNYKFIGKFVNFNSATTKIVPDANIENYYAQIKSGVATNELNKELPYISESSYNELVANKLAKQNKVEMLFALALEANKYVKDTCKLAANATDTNCLKKESVKFVASYLYNKHNIKLSANILEEMYDVYVGKLKVSHLDTIYEKKYNQAGYFETSNFQNFANCSLYYGYYISYPQPENYNWVKNYANGCWNINTQDINSRDVTDTNKKYYLILETESENGKGEMELNLNFTASYYISSSKTISLVAPSTVGKFELDVTDVFTAQGNYFKTWASNPNVNLSSGFSLTANTTNPKDLSGRVKIKSVKLISGNKEYKNNINSNISPVVSTTELNTKIYGAVEAADKNLLGAIYKQKKIASLFGSEKLISKDSFAELVAFGFTLSDLVIKDMLVEYSFTPYGKCENMVDELAKRNCRKEIFVKYLFAIVKYEYDKELSAIALDELFEVTEGNLSVPNNVDDYKIRNSQIFNLNSTEKTHAMESYYGYSVDTNGNYMSGCQSGLSVPGQLYINNTCDISFVVPQELATRKNEIESVTISLLANQGRPDSNSPNPYNPGQVYFYPVVSNNSFSYNGNGIPPANIFYAWNANPLIVSPSSNIKLGEKTEVNITNVVSAIVKGEVNNYGLRIISNAQNVNYTNAGKYELNVKFVKDAPQNDAKYLTAYIVNPKDSTVYEHVLQVLARVDKNYITQNNDIVSKDAWNEIKNTNIKTNSDVKNIFDINEKLQKDDTLAAVYNYVFTQQGIYLTRETLEELFMVFENRLSMPEDFQQYDFAQATTTKLYYEKASWTTYSQDYNGTIANTSCVATNTSKCFLKLPEFDKSYLHVNSAILNLQGSGGWNNQISLNAVIEPISTGTNLTAAKLNTSTLNTNNTGGSQRFDLTNIYNSYKNNEYTKNGLVISSSNYSVTGLEMLVNNNHFVEIFTTPNFKVFDRSKLENLSVVPGVYSVRSLADDDFITEAKLISPETRKELESVGIKSKQDIYQYITLVANFGDSNKISRVEKINYLKNIFTNIKTGKNISLSREALEEIYYIINNKLFFSLETDQTIQKDNFNRANSSIIGANWIENYDGGDNLKIADNNLNMVWNNQPWGSFKSVYQNLPLQNDIKISYKWKVAPGATVDGYYPYIGVRSNGGNTYTDSYGVALLYIPQVARIDAHVYNNGSLINNVTNVVTNPKINSNYNIEINIDKNNFLEFRIWEEGTTKPINPNAKWNNNGAAFTPASSGNKITLLTLHGSAANNSVNVMMDDLVVSKLTAETNITLANNTPVFNRATFPLLEPITNVKSVNDQAETENISYNISQTEIKNISRETVGELSLVGITTKQQIMDVFVLTKTTEKDSQLSFFKEYFEVQKNYTFSREALEEIYLVYLGKAVFNANPSSLVTLKETKNIQLTQIKNGTNGGACSFVGTTAESGYPNYSCFGDFKITQKDGYKLSKVNLILVGDVHHSSYTYIKTQVKYKDVYEQAEKITDISKYYDLTKDGEYRITYVNNSGALNQLNFLTSLSLESIYEPITATNDRENFGELSNVSTEEKLDANYSEEIANINFNLGTTSTSTIWKTSSPAMKLLASSSISTVQEIKDLFNNASTTNLSKNSKLYFVYKKIKDTRGTELDRLTLEEMWRIYLDQQLFQGGTTITTTQTQTIYPIAMSSALNYKLNGTVGSADKKKDEVRIDKPILSEVNATTANGRTNDANGAYQFNSGYLKLPNTVPAITTNPQTFSLWYKGTGGQALFSTTSKGTRNFIALWFYQGRLVPELGWTNGNGYVALIGNKVITDNLWHKIDLVLENIDNKAVIKLYINGELDMDSRNQPHNNNQPMNLSGISNELVIGAVENYASGQMQPGMNGNVDDFKLYNQSLTTEEIRKEYQIDTNTITPIITQTTITNQNTLEAYNRDRYQELSYISPISELERIFNLETGITPSPSFTPSMPEDNPELTPQENLAPTLNKTQDTNNTTQEVQISPETLSLLNPLNYPYTIISPTSIDLQINGVIYEVNLNNYTQFYTDLANNTIDTLAKYINKINNVSEEISYTKYFPSQYYEYDSRGIVTINVPFNGKVVFTTKYKENVNTSDVQIVENQYLVNNYLATPILTLNNQASTTEVIKRDVWGIVLNNSINKNKNTNTKIGYTGHVWDERSELTYSHARYLSNANKTWLSHDPFSIENFSNGTWLMNPQIQNAYSYASNNPVNMVDPTGLKPTELEAAYMAKDIYSNTPGTNLQGGWKYDSTLGGGKAGFKIGVYSRTENGVTEYSLVGQGTEMNVFKTNFYSDWANNLVQVPGASPDVYNAVDATTQFVNDNEGAEVTAVGHSKSGPEMAMAAVKNNLNAILFNPASGSYFMNGRHLDKKKYNKNIDTYIVSGEVLNLVENVAAKPLGTNVQYLNPGPNYTVSPGVVKVTSVNFLPISTSFQRHGMNAVINSLENRR